MCIRDRTGNAGQMTSDALLNIPMIEGVLAGRFSVQTRRDDGFMRDRSGRKWNETDSKSARAKLLWTPTDTFEAMFTADYFGARETSGLGNCLGMSGGATGLNFLTAIAGRMDDLVRACTPTDDYYLSNDNDPNALEIDTRAVALELSWDMGWGTLNSLTSSRRMETMSGSWGWATDFVGEPSNSLEVLEGSADGVQGNPRSPFDQVSQEFTIESESFDDRLSCGRRVLVPRKRDQLHQCACLAQRGSEPLCRGRAFVGCFGGCRRPRIRNPRRYIHCEPGRHRS